MGLVPLLAAAKEEPVQFFNGKLSSLMENSEPAAPKGRGSAPGWVEPERKKPCALAHNGWSVLPPGYQTASYFFSGICSCPP